MDHATQQNVALVEEAAAAAGRCRTKLPAFPRSRRLRIRHGLFALGKTFWGSVDQSAFLMCPSGCFGCHVDYRDSVFERAELVIADVTFALPTARKPNLRFVELAQSDAGRHGRAERARSARR